MNKQVKKGQVIKNYLGEFAKVTDVKNGFYYLSLWVRKKETAEVAEQHASRLNEFGLEAAMKKTETAEDAKAEVEEAEVAKKTKSKK